jgi:hypothetical protein
MIYLTNLSSNINLTIQQLHEAKECRTVSRSVHEQMQRIAPLLPGESTYERQLG